MTARSRVRLLTRVQVRQAVGQSAARAWPARRRFGLRLITRIADETTRRLGLECVY